ncbi:MAG: extracellular solute-binding protein [Coriobacteriia bacterium]|nr:extracellular solute-binding protein [Coriobacteriia bacterium]
MRRFTLPPLTRRVLTLALAALLVAALAACSAPSGPTTGSTEVQKTTDVILASTTSTQDSGLFDVLIPAFEKANPSYKVKVIAVGSGEAMKLGEKKDADVLLVHSPAAEKSFVASGFGEPRKPVMYNDFVIVGPASDPAGIKGGAKAADAFAMIAAARATFVSRGDDSGTHNKEKSIWASATVEPKGAWYLSIGQGMGETLKLANEKKGYTIVDRATWLTSTKSNPDLVLLVEGDKKLFNPYSVIVVIGAKNPEGATAFSDWVVGPDGQKVIGDFGVATYGQQIFVPDAGSAK